MFPDRTYAFPRIALLPAITLTLLAQFAPAHAQPSSFRTLCTTYGANSVEPIGDREGHSIQAAAAACITQGGALDGTVTTQSTLWEIDKGVGVMLSSHGVSRKPGAVAAYVNTSGSLNFEVVDGKVTGWTAKGKGRDPLATGSAAGLLGKTYNWEARPTGPRTYVLAIVLE